VRRLLITGSNRGLGRSIARYFRRRAYRVASLNRTLTGEPWLGEVPCDLSYKDDITRAMPAAVCKLGGHVDVCILNAAVRHIETIADMTDDAWEDSLQVNLSSVFQLTRAVLPCLGERSGNLIIVGSQAGAHAFEGGAAYCSSKAALEMLAEVIALETSACGVRTTVVSPWAIRNRAGDTSSHKISPSTVARLIYELVRLPSDAVVSRLEIRPCHPLPSPLQGMSRLQVL
jgi:3-oxoacyl-[acyl-carrier protein] reductase